MTHLQDAIRNATDTQIDACWAILKYKEVGILRKLKCMSLIFDLDTQEVIAQAPTNDGRIVDYETRKLIHEVLIKASQNKQ